VVGERPAPCPNAHRREADEFRGMPPHRREADELRGMPPCKPIPLPSSSRSPALDTGEPMGDVEGEGSGVGPRGVHPGDDSADEL